MTDLTPEDIFGEALELPSAERAAFLDRACRRNQAIRREVESLLRIADENPHLLNFPPGAPVWERADPEVPSAAGQTGAAEHPRTQDIPDRLGGYRIIGVCGSGGMGIVYRGEDAVLGRIVAIKALANGHHGTTVSPRFRARLEDEARFLARLKHPNVATIYSLQYENDVPFIVMEYVEGKTLREILAEGSAVPIERLQISLGIAAGLEAAHLQNIVHRDLKPTNIMVERDRNGPGRVKILDFGIARIAEMTGEQGGPDGGLGVTGRAGTPGYMSPEQRRGKTLDHRADVWAFGRILRHCFEGGGEPELPRRILRRLESLTLRCQRERPEDRPQSMREVREELEQLLDELRNGRAYQRFGRAISVARAVLVALAVIASVVIVRQAYTRAHAIPQSAAAGPGSAVSVRFSDGRSQVFAVPDSIHQQPDSARVLLAGSDRDRLILGWTAAASGTAEANRLLVWDRAGRMVATIPAAGDTPFDGAGDPMVARTRFVRIYPPSAAGAPLRTLEYSRYYPSVLRSFALGPSSVAETSRLYHSGNISEVFRESGSASRLGWVWLAGRVREDGILRQAAGGVGFETYMLACFEEDSLHGTMILPSFTEPDSLFLQRHSEPVQAARPFIYFLVRGFWSVSSPRLAWANTSPIRIDAVTRSNSGSMSVLISDGVRLDFVSEGRNRIRLNASVSGGMLHAFEERAGRLGVPTDALVHRFFADSVLILVDSRDGLEITGDLRDIRGSLPPRWKGWEGRLRSL